MEKRKKYTEEYKKEAARLMMSRGERSVREVAQELGLEDAQLYAWRKRYAEELGFSKPSASNGDRRAEHRELEKLRREVRDLKRTNEFLKKAAAFFAKEGQ